MNEDNRGTERAACENDDARVWRGGSAHRASVGDLQPYRYAVSSTSIQVIERLRFDDARWLGAHGVARNVIWGCLECRREPTRRLKESRRGRPSRMRLRAMPWGLSGSNHSLADLHVHAAENTSRSIVSAWYRRLLAACLKSGSGPGSTCRFIRPTFSR